jgi:ABC-type phosphate/phosphonate transport system substrate-binding protein
MLQRRFVLIALLLATPGCIGASASTVVRTTTRQPEAPISFLSIVVDEDTAAADARLKRFLEQAIAKSKNEPGRRAVRFPHQAMPYGEVIRAFAERDSSKAYLARITPYAYVAAEMLGAKLEILAIYKSVATSDTLYHAYFVARKDEFVTYANWKPENGEPTLENVVTYLKRLKRSPAKFVYHDRFSTSSYFLPSLYFKTHGVFAMSHSINPELVPMEVVRLPSTSSTDLIDRVLREKEHLAAVWDGTKNKFERDRASDAQHLVFVKIPTPVPNDFLVASGVEEATKRVIIDAIKGEPGAGRSCAELSESPAYLAVSGRQARQSCAGSNERPKDDFDAWYIWDSNDNEVSDRTREALARLRNDARQQLTPVVVRVKAGNDEDTLLQEYVEATKEAVRLSGTEFVLEDHDLHRRVDMTWTLESAHDGALKLTSTLDSSFAQSAEEFPVSFVDRSDLPRRIADLVRSRLPRIRYVWPYEQKYPAVLRDLDFTPSRNVKVQRISWMDPGRNEYEEDTPFSALIEDSTNFSKLRLSDEVKFPRNPDGSFNFDPMSNVAYRVVITREPHAGPIWKAMPYSFIALFLLACIGLVVDLRRRRPEPRGLHQTYQRMVESYHRPWRKQEIEESGILWSDPKCRDEFVKELKSGDSFLEMVQGGGLDFNLGPLPIKLSVLIKLGARLIGRGPQLWDLGDGPSRLALDKLVQFLVRNRRLSPFVGFPEPSAGSPRPAWPIEWEALNDIISRHLQQLGVSDKRVDAQVSADSSMLSTVVSKHFGEVLKKATRGASFFCQTWVVRQSDGRLVCEGEMRSALMLWHEHGSAPASKVRLEVVVPGDTPAAPWPVGSPFQAWVLGKIAKWSIEHGTLVVHVKPLAILKSHDYSN